MNHNSDLENLKDERALRREKKQRPKMKKHGHALKKPSLRPVQHIHKITRPKPRKAGT